MLLIWFVSSVVALITKTASNKIGENRCDISPSCMNDNLSHSVIRSNQPALRCTKRTSCNRLDKNLFAVNQINKIDIHLKDIQIKQKKNNYQVQVILSSYDDLIKQGNQSLLVKFSFGLNDPCYEFLIPFSIIMDSKDILFPCFSIPILQRHLLFYFYVHKETDEFISVQAMNYSLSNVTVGQWLGGSLFRITYDLDDEFLSFSLNATQNLKCLFNYSISVYKSSISLQRDPCSIKQTPVYHWSDTLNSPYHRLNMSRKLLSLSQKYCIYAVFNKSQQCGTLYPEQFAEFDFFQLPPPGANKFYTNVLEHSCENWNFSCDVKNYKKKIIATMTFWCQFSSCFSSYYMYLYKFNSPTCDPDYGHPTPEVFNFEAECNNTEVRVFENVTIGYYCIQIVPFSNNTPRLEWTRYFGSIIVTETAVSSNTESNNKNENPEFGTKFTVAISLLLFLIVFALWSCSKHIRRCNQQNQLSQVFSDEEKGKENIPVSMLSVEKVFLFHSHDDISLKNDVSWLKKFLEDGAKFNVLTLSDVLPEIVEQSSRTVSNILECGCSGKGPSCTSNKRFIIVISEKVLCNIDNDHFIWKSLEERAFHMVLNSITADWGKAYCHLFLVAFNESIFEDCRFEKIVPKNTIGAYYTIPNDLISLCMKLGFSSSREELLMCLKRY